MAELIQEQADGPSRRLDDEEVVSHSTVIDGTTLQALAEEQGKPLPPQVVQNLAHYNYFVFDFRLGAKLPRGYKSVKSVAMDFAFECDGIFDVEDGLPKAEWVDSNMSGDISVAIVFKGGLHFKDAKDVPPAPPTPPTGTGVDVGIDTGIRFKASWSPKIATIRPSFAGRSCQLVLNAKPGMGVEGAQTISLIAKIDRAVTGATFRLKEFRAVYRRDAVFSDTAIVRDLLIPVDLRTAR